MADTSEYFDRIREQIDVRLLASKLVVIVGIGTVGAPIADHLAKDGVGRLLLIDGDMYEETNRIRHMLPPKYLGRNKAKAMKEHLESELIPGLSVFALPRYVDSSMPDYDLDRLLDPADLIIAATGETAVQRRLGRRALALDIPAIFPGLIPNVGGEVFLQTSPASPCFLCRDNWRRQGESVRGAQALGVEAMPVIQTAIELSLGILDPDSRYEELTLPDEDDPDQRVRQLFMLLPGASRLAEVVERDDDCPSCAVGPSSLRPEAVEAWQRAERERTTPPFRTPPHSVPPTTSTAPPVARSAPTPAEPGFVSMLFLKVSVFILALAFTAAPFGVMYFVEPARNADKGNVLLGLISICCGFWFLGGLVAIGYGFVYLFKAWD